MIVGFFYKGVCQCQASGTSLLNYETMKKNLLIIVILLCAGYTIAHAQVLQGDASWQSAVNDTIEIPKWKIVTATDITLLKQKSGRGDVLAQGKLALCNIEGFVVHDLNAARKLLETAYEGLKSKAESGDAEAQYYLGLCNKYGCGTTEDHKNAAEWFQKSAEQHFAPASCDLAYYYYNAYGVEQQDWNMAEKLYRESAEQGYPPAEYAMGGYCYAQGVGIERNEEKEVEWYFKAVRHDYHAAQLALGNCYEKGKIVTTNATEAVKWYRKSAMQGNSTAQYALGMCYYHGYGVKKNLVECKKWIRMAAKNENYDADDFLVSMGWK